MSQLITAYPLPIFAIISISIFLGLSGVILFWIYKLETPESLEERARIPLNDDIHSSEAKI